MSPRLIHPSREERAHAYAWLQGLAPIPEPRATSLAQACLWARFDPRLAELVVRFVVLRWREVEPLALGHAIRSSSCPSAAGPLLAFAKLGADRWLRAWMTLVLEGVSVAGGGELYFVGARPPGHRAALLDAERPLRPYADWGYLGREDLGARLRPLGRAQSTPARISRQIRRQTIDSLIAECRRTGHRSLLARDYLAALGQAVSARQAERDLKLHPALRATGRTRARRYAIVAEPPARSPTLGRRLRSARSTRA